MISRERITEIAEKINSPMWDGIFVDVEFWKLTAREVEEIAYLALDRLDILDRTGH